jgi:hypothetical protein
MRNRSMRGAVTTAGAVVALLMSATPAAAATHPFSLEPVTGLVIVGGLELDIPGGEIEGCPGGTVSIAGTVDDATNTVSSSLGVDIPFAEPIFGSSYHLDASGSGSGAYGLLGMTVTYSTIDLTISEYTGMSECEVGDVACNGTATLAIQGAKTYPVLEPWPPFNTGDSVTIGTVSGSIEVDGSCPFPINLLLYDGGPLSIDGSFEQI